MVKIVIIGAGLAGVACAVKLFDNGFGDIVILEAENRIGGRIQSVDFGTGRIDLGGQWIHGEKNNQFYDAIKDHFSFGSSHFEDIDPLFLMSDGSRADQEQCMRIFNLAHKILEHSPEELKKFDGTLGDYFLENFKKAISSKEFNDIDKDLIKMMIHNLHRESMGYHASTTWFDLSAKWNAVYDIAGGNHYITWRDKGFGSVFDILLDKVPKRKFDRSKIKLNTKVVNIRWSQFKNHKTILTCSDDSKYFADHLIVTVPLGVLKAHHYDLFTPSLPERKILTIEKTGIGNLGKIFLEFARPFWPTDGSFVTYSFLWKEEDANKIRSTDREWLLGISTFHAVDGFSNLIQAFVSGPLIKTFEEISDEKLIEDCLWMLENFVGRKLPKLTNMRRSKWIKENFLGSYSFVSRDMEIANVGPKDLSEPLKKSNGKSFLHFAGEATDIVYPSFVQGAVQSGWRAADEIINENSKIIHKL